jgi:hypothetical protein
VNYIQISESEIKPYSHEDGQNTLIININQLSVPASAGINTEEGKMKKFNSLIAVIIASVLMAPVFAQSTPDQSQGVQVDNMPYGAQMDPQAIEAMRQRHMQMQQYMRSQQPDPSMMQKPVMGPGSGMGMGRGMGPGMGMRPGYGKGPGFGRGMMNPQKHHQMMQQRHQHMQNMEQRLAHIEAMLEQLLAAQSK